MAIDPRKLQAFASQGKSGGGDDGQKGKGKGGGKPDEEAQEGGDGRFGVLLPLLEANADEIAANLDELAPETLDDPTSDIEDEEREMLVDGVNMLPSDLKAELKSALGGGIEAEEASELADHLESEGMVSDPERFAGWLLRVADVLDEVEDGEGEDEDDQDQDVNPEAEDESGAY